MTGILLRVAVSTALAGAPLFLASVVAQSPVHRGGVGVGVVTMGGSRVGVAELILDAFEARAGIAVCEYLALTDPRQPPVR